MELPTCILDDPAVVQCYEIVVEAGPSIVLRMEALPSAARCPKCLRLSPRIHSRYRRKLADLPWANVPVRIEVSVRRFVCDNRACARRIFSERLTTLGAPGPRSVR